MNANQLINMITRMFVRKVVNKGLNAGIDRVSGGGKSRDQMTDAERSHGRKGKQAARTARKAARITRRVGKF
tara:strand:+ start:147 stop:362 length:216 start_codon:yes stop_codon:yes gene_type:complete